MTAIILWDDASTVEAWRVYDAVEAEARRIRSAAIAAAERSYDATIDEPRRVKRAAIAEAWRVFCAREE